MARSRPYHTEFPDFVENQLKHSRTYDEYVKQQQMVDPFRLNQTNHHRLLAFYQKWESRSIPTQLFCLRTFRTLSGNQSMIENMWSVVQRSDRRVCIGNTCRNSSTLYKQKPQRTTGICGLSSFVSNDKPLSQAPTKTVMQFTSENTNWCLWAFVQRSNGPTCIMYRADRCASILHHTFIRKG